MSPWQEAWGKPCCKKKGMPVFTCQAPEIAAARDKIPPKVAHWAFDAHAKVWQCRSRFGTKTVCRCADCSFFAWIFARLLHEFCVDFCQHWVHDFCQHWVHDFCQHWVLDFCQHWVHDFCALCARFFAWIFASAGARFLPALCARFLPPPRARFLSALVHDFCQR